MAQGSKRWAFRDPYGGDKVTAWEIADERWAKYGGEPTGHIYFSTHKPGKRKKMKHVMKTKPYFAYLDANEGGGGDGGESLTHRLFKEAIAGMPGTELKLKGLKNHFIRILESVLEKRLPTRDEHYADIFIRFESDTALGLKWSNELYIEVHHTNAVHASKQDQIRAAGVAAIEVDIHDLFVYPYSDEDTSGERERLHVEKIRRILAKGFLAGRIINDPSSREYLEREVLALTNQLLTTQKSLNELREKARADEEALSKRIADQSVTIEADRATKQALREELKKEGEKVRQEKEKNKKLSLELDELASTNQWLSRWLIGVAVSIALVAVVTFVVRTM